MPRLIELYRQSLAQQGIEDPRDDEFVVREFLGPLAEQNRGLFDLDPDLATEWRAIREADSPGAFGGIANTARTAYDRSRQALEVMGGVDQADAEQIAERERAIRERPSSVAWEDWGRSEGMDAAKVFLRDPIEITSNIIASGLAGSLPAVAGGLAGGAAGAKLGGLAGSGAGPAGTAGGAALGGIIGAASGTGAGSLAVEFGSKYLDVLREAGADLADPDSIQRVLEDPDLRGRARSLAFRRGVPVAAFDAASAGLAGKFFKGLSGATRGQIVRQGAAEAATQGALGGAGEVAGALAAGEEIKPGAVFEEVVGELGPGAAEVAGSVARRPVVPTPQIAAPTPQIPGAAPHISLPVAPLEAPPVAAPRTSAEIVLAAERMDDATALARVAELRGKAQLTPEEDTELQILLARAPKAPAPVPQPESDYLYTIQQAQPHPQDSARIIPGYVQVDPLINGGRGEPLTEAQRAALPQPPPWLPTGQYTLAQVVEAISKGEPTNAVQIESPAAIPLQPASEAGEGVREGNAVDQVAPGAGVAAPIVEEPVPPVAPVPPKDAAPEVAAQGDLPKPSEIPAAVPSTAPGPVEQAAVVATQATPQGFAFGEIVEGGPTIDFRDFEPIAPQEWERALRANLRHPQAARGDKTGARSTTRVGLALVEPDGKGIIFSGVVEPQRLQRVAGGTETNAVALQQMGTGAKSRAILPGGDQPVLLREVLAAGYKPLAVVHFTGEPARIFQRFEDVAAFDRAYGATAKTTGRAGAGRVETPHAPADVRAAIRGEREIQAQIDRLGAEYQRADKVSQEALALEIVRLFDELSTVTRTGQSQTGDVALQAVPDSSRAAVDADRAQQFIAVVDRLRRQGANVEVFTRVLFQMGVRSEIESQIAVLKARQAQTQSVPERRRFTREIYRRELRLGELDRARGATFSPWHISLAVEDAQNATTSNLVTLLHEASEALTMRLNPVMRGRVSRAITGSIEDIRKRTTEAAARTGMPVAVESGAFDALAESLAQRLTAEGVPDAESLARAIWQWVKDLYYRTVMALQASFGAEPSDEMALDWFENQLRRAVGGDYDYRIARVLDRYLPEPMASRIQRYEQPSGTPGGVVDYWNPYARTIQQPGVRPDTAEGAGWNIEFQTMPAQTVGGESIPGPEARARIDAAALNRFAEQMEAVRVASGTELAWPEWWAMVGTGDDPRIVVATLGQRVPGAESAQIGGPRMTKVMSDLAALEARRLIENVQAKAVGRLADTNEQIEAESDRVIAAAKEVNRLEGDRRNAELQEGALQQKLRGLVRRFVQDNSAGYRLAEQQGELAEAVRQAEGLIDGEPIPEQYQQVFKAVLDGDVPVFDYVRALADLDLPLSDMTQAEVVRAIRDNGAANETLARLARNRPLTVALAVLARRNAGMVDEIHLGWLRDAELYRTIHDELQTIRQANDEQLREMIGAMDDRVKAATFRDRIRRDYLKRRRSLNAARSRVAVAQERVEGINAALPALGQAVARAQQSGSEAPSEWAPVEGAVFTEMKLGDDGQWRSSRRTLHFRPDGSAVDGEAVRRAVWQNNLWLKANEAKRGSAAWERIYRQTTELGMLDLTAQYPAAQGFRVDKLLAPLVSEARQLGAAGARVAQMLQQFQFIRLSHGQEVQTNAQAWSQAWSRLQKLTGIRDNGQLREQLYDPISYYLNTEPGLDEEAALREAVKMGRARLTGEVPEGFNEALTNLLRASKTGFEYLVQQANQYGAFVKDPRLKSELRRAVAQGWLTSMRGVDGGLVMRITRDMEKAGWKLMRRQVEDTRGRQRPEIVRGVTFEDLTAEETADAAGLDAMLQPLFTPGIIRDWLVPFINKGGVEVFKDTAADPIPQMSLQNAWQNAQGNVLRWIDLVAQEVRLPAPSEEQPNPLADFRLSMLRQLDALFGMESKVAYETSQTRDMFDPMGPKPHVMMDARLNDTLPPEHLDFALLDPHTSQMLLSEIAFNGAFGRNGERMVQTLFELRQEADAKRQQYESLTGTTKNARVAEAVARGWDYDDLERAATRSRDIERFQTKLEAFMGVNHPGGPFDSARAGMAVINFMAGQIVDNPKTGLYDWLSLFERPFAQRSLGPRTMKSSARALGTAAKTGLGSLFEALNLHILRASEYERDVAQALGGSRNQPWAQAVSDIGPGGRQALSYKVLIRPLGFLRYVQNKGMGSPAQARDFPRAAPIPGLGVNNWLGQIAAVGNVSSQLRELETMVRAGIDYFASHRDDAQNPAFRFKARDLGLGRLDTGVFDWWRTKAVEYGMGTLEDLVRASVPRAAVGERLLSRDQVLRVAQMVSQELVGQSSINTMPSLLVTNPWLRTVFPLLRWPFWKMHQIHEGLRTAEGKLDYASAARGMATLAMWNLPIGLAFTFALDRYDEDLLGKKSNLPGVGGTAALPFVGPVAEAIMADRSIPDTLKAYLVRSARAGNIYGLGSDLVGQIASPTDAGSGRRVFSLDQRVLVMSQFLNLQQALANAVGQDWTATWSSVWHPLFRSLGGNGGLHVLDVANNLLGLDNAEARQVARTNASNWLRASAAELEVELRPGGSGTPTAMSVWTRTMMDAAMANDRIGFLEAYRKALEAARKTVAADPTVKPADREREAESRVRSGWRGRDPLGIFARRPTEVEVRRLLSIMDDSGAQAVRDALNRYSAFSRLIGVSQVEQQQRALTQRLTRAPAIQNPFRRTTVPTY